MHAVFVVRSLFILWLLLFPFHCLLLFCCYIKGVRCQLLAPACSKGVRLMSKVARIHKEAVCRAARSAKPGSRSGRALAPGKPVVQCGRLQSCCCQGLACSP